MKAPESCHWKPRAGSPRGPDRRRESQIKNVEPRVATILAPLDPVERLSGTVVVWKRKHLRVIEKRAAEASA